MSFKYTIKLMILCKTPVISLTKPFRFKIEVKASTMAQADALMDALRVSVFKEGTTERYRLPDGLSWERMAEHMLGSIQVRAPGSRGFCCRRWCIWW